MTTKASRRKPTTDTTASASTDHPKRTAKTKGVGRGKGRGKARPKSHPAARRMAQQSEAPATAPTPTPTMSQHLGSFREAYTKVKGATGQASAHCGDDLASLLVGLGPTEVVALASKLLNLDLARDYSHLNPGQRRMNAGNRLRGAVRAGRLTLSKIETASRQARAA